MTVYYTLFCLVSIMMYQIAQALTLILPERFDATRDSVERNMRNYNIMIGVVCLAHLIVLLYFFFTPTDIPARIALICDLTARLLALIIYTVTCAILYKKL